MSSYIFGCDVDPTLLFFRGSTQTRTSFSAAMNQLSGYIQAPSSEGLRLSLDNSPGEGEVLIASRYKDCRLTEKLLKLTNDARFIHVMPFDRGNEVDDGIADGQNSIVYDRAENLLHVRKAFLASILADVSTLEKISGKKATE